LEFFGHASSRFRRKATLFLMPLVSSFTFEELPPPRAGVRLQFRVLDGDFGLGSMQTIAPTGMWSYIPTSLY